MRSRTNSTIIRLSDEELADLNEKVSRVGGSRENFIRQCISGVAIKERPPVDVPKLIQEVRRVGINLNQILRIANANGLLDAPQLRKAMEQNREVEVLIVDPPFGYKKSSEDKNKWIIDEPAAEVVKRIFQMSVSGLGPTQIAKRLKADGVLTPSEYLHSIGVNCPTKPPMYPHNWCSSTVAGILDRQEYTGDTVNFRSFSQSFKLKKRLDKPQEEWKVFPNTHPAIIDQETFELVQDLRQHRRRPTKSGIVSMFSGLLYCADCGSKLGYSATNNYKREQAFFFCAKYRQNSEVCSAHYIWERIIGQLVLEGLQRLMWYVQVYEKRFAQEQMERFGLQEKKALAEKRNGS